MRGAYRYLAVRITWDREGLLVEAKGGCSSFAARSVGVLLLIIETGADKGPQSSGVADASGWTGLQVSVNGSGSFSG